MHPFRKNFLVENYSPSGIASTIVSTNTIGFRYPMEGKSDEIYAKSVSKFSFFLCHNRSLYYSSHCLRIYAAYELPRFIVGDRSLTAAV